MTFGKMWVTNSRFLHTTEKQFIQQLIYQHVRFSPVLLLLIEVRHDGQQAADEGVTGLRGGAGYRGLSSQNSAAPLRLHQLLLHLHILLLQQSKVLLQFLHLLCAHDGQTVAKRAVERKE